MAPIMTQDISRGVIIIQWTVGHVIDRVAANGAVELHPQKGKEIKNLSICEPP
jgi:hypothetical protein